jgi:hypothetical protein
VLWGWHYAFLSVMPVIQVYNNMGTQGQPQIKVFTRTSIAACTRWQKVYGNPRVSVMDHSTGRDVQLLLTREEFNQIDWSKVSRGTCFTTSLRVYFDYEIVLINRGNVKPTKTIFFDAMEDIRGVMFPLPPQGAAAGDTQGAAGAPQGGAGGA